MSAKCEGYLAWLWGHGSRRAGIMRRDHAAVWRGPAEAIEHLVGNVGNMDDGLAAVALMAQVSGHHTDDVRAAAGKDDAGIVPHTFEFAGLVGDTKIFG